MLIGVLYFWRPLPINSYSKRTWRSGNCNCPGRMREGEEAPTRLIPTDSLSLEDKNGVTFRYVTFFLGYKMMDEIQEPNSAKCSVELAEPFRTDEKATFPSLVFGTRPVKKVGI